VRHFKPSGVRRKTDAAHRADVYPEEAEQREQTSEAEGVMHELLLAQINAVHGTSFRLAQRYADGERGAFALIA